MRFDFYQEKHLSTTDKKDSPPAEPCRLTPPVLWHEAFLQTLEVSFSIVSKPKFASKYAFESSRRDLHNALLCTAFGIHNRKLLCTALQSKCFLSKFCQKKCKNKLTKNLDCRAIQKLCKGCTAFGIHNRKLGKKDLAKTTPKKEKTRKREAIKQLATCHLELQRKGAANEKSRE